MLLVLLRLVRLCRQKAELCMCPYVRACMMNSLIPWLCDDTNGKAGGVECACARVCECVSVWVSVRAHRAHRLPPCIKARLSRQRAHMTLGAIRVALHRHQQRRRRPQNTQTETAAFTQRYGRAQHHKAGQQAASAARHMTAELTGDAVLPAGGDPC